MIRTAALLLLAAPAVAQEPNCAPRTVIAASLTQKYGEVQQFAGIAGDGMLIEAWANPETRTWTLLRVSPNGTACFVGEGDNWTVAMPRKKGQPT